MVRMQIQLPDDLYDRARKLAAQREVSLAEVVRRGLEQLLTIYPVDRPTEWKLNPPVNTELQADPFADPDRRLKANISPDVADRISTGKGKRK